MTREEGWDELEADSAEQHVGDAEVDFNEEWKDHEKKAERQGKLF